MPAFAGNLNTISLAEVLRLLVATKQTGLLKLTMGSEQGHLALENGQILHAIAGPLVGAPALYQFIVWRDANFEFAEQPIPPAAPRDLAAYDPQTLIDGVAKKIDELAALQQAVPTLDSVLYYIGGESLKNISATPSELALVILADGTRTVQQIADQAQQSPLEVARIMAKFRLAGVVDLVSQVIPGATPIKNESGSLPPPLSAAPSVDDAPKFWRGKRIS